MTPLEEVAALPERFPNDQNELNFLRGFAGSVAKAAELGHIPMKFFLLFMAAGEATEHEFRGRTMI